MRKIIFVLLFAFTTGISIAQERTPVAADSSQVEFYSSMEDFLNKNNFPSVHITILAVTENLYEFFSGTNDFKTENFQSKKEERDYTEEHVLEIIL